MLDKKNKCKKTNVSVKIFSMKLTFNKILSSIPADHYPDIINKYEKLRHCKYFEFKLKNKADFIILGSDNCLKWYIKYKDSHYNFENNRFESNITTKFLENFYCSASIFAILDQLEFIINNEEILKTAVRYSLVAE